MAAADVSFNTSVSEFLGQAIFPLIVEGFAAKGFEITAEDLFEFIQTPTPTSGHTVPSMAFGGIIHPANTAKTAGAAAEPSAPLIASSGAGNPLPGRCIYQYRRGEKKGQYCEKAVTPGESYCNNCIKNRKKIAKEGKVPTSTAPVTAPEPTAATSSGGGQLSVVMYDETRQLYREPTHNFIVHQVSPGTIAVIGKIIEGESKLFPLSEEEKTIARSIGLVISEVNQ